MVTRASALAAVLLLGLTVLSSVGAAQAADRANRPDQLERPARGTTPAGAQQALADAQALFADDEGGRAARSGEVDERGATLVLRDLVVALPRLTGRDRAAAQAILARPTDGPDEDTDGYTTRAEKACGTHVCVHWVERTDDAVPRADRDDDGRPDYAETALATLQRVHDTYAAAGYRPPRPDGRRGGSSRTDVYLADIGSKGLYGYCTTDESIPADQWVTWAYCVLDNDYASDEFGTGTPLGNLRVTAAHEYFHAVQYAYDYFEDRWFLEATATWAEDELFDGVDDSVNYLPAGPLGQPRTSLDFFGAGHQYGTWIYFRYLTERMRSSKGGMPTLVRDMWRRADAVGSTRGGRYSLQAVRAALAERGADFAATFARFAEAGRRSRGVYDEGRANRYPVAPLWSRSTLSPDRRRTPWASGTLNHLTSSTARFVPARTMTDRRWRLRLRVDLADRSQGSAAMVTVHPRHRPARTRFLRLDPDGDGTTRVPFSRRRVEAVELTVVNASTRFDCWQGSPYACAGWSDDDFLGFRLRGVAFR